MTKQDELNILKQITKTQESEIARLTAKVKMYEKIFQEISDHLSTDHHLCEACRMTIYATYPKD